MLTFGLAAIGAVLALVAAAPAAAQDPSFAVSAAGVVGGAFDTDGVGTDPGLDQTGFQLGFSWETWDHTSVGVRLARVAFSDEFLENVFDPDLTYVTVGGEYHFNESFYRSGMYVGLGLYQMEGFLGEQTLDDTSLGFVIGATGDFPMTKNFSILVEVSAHYADLELGAQFYGFLTAGLAYHF